ncbi:MAG TPA: valine--tRNA ligase [Candidatus Nanoarchaeia archaeon]|nr:valine--tRNA ligase [Candidatus Nanoarchaeia archaeon]
MAQDFEKQYNPADYEDAINKEWLDSGFFNPDNLKLPDDAPPYAIVLPPPNITDKLHVGHAMMIAIEDLLIRYKRMNGFCALWIPGTDHAAIATQNVVEKRLFKETGQTRHDLGREKFLAEVNKFATVTQKTILNQIKKMGASLDWSRLAFTLDEQRGKAVKKMFIEMYNDGVIYRGERVINWCPRCKSTLADDEVEYKEQTAKLYTFKYSKDFPIAISTTRPETKLGDTAVAVNPRDERYKKYIGSTFEVDFVGVPLKIKIIADIGVEMDFGTGALGVTPAHLMVDYQMSQKYDLEMIKVIGEDATINPGFGDYSGLKAAQAREKIVERLRESGLLEKEEEIANNLSQCYRCETPIEPIPSKQWFVDVDKKLKKLGDKSLKEISLEASKSGEIKFTPERFQGQYENWMNNLHDWCISRQIWYGHRIPAFYQIKDKKEKIKNWDLKIYGENIYQDLKNKSKTIETRAGRAKGDGKDWAEFKVGDLIDFSLVEDKTEKVIESGVKKKISGISHFSSIAEMLEKISLEKIYPGKTEADYRALMENNFKDRLEKFGIWAFELVGLDEQIVYVSENKPEGDGWIQDEDTLDTWFSSGMWTFSTLNWPDSVRPGRTSAGEARFVKTGDLAKYHPTAVLETGFEILTLWVSRMILMSYYALGEKPFSDVYLHGNILDEHGKKMSKSKGNGVDPLDVIAKYGTDALRLSLLIGSTPGNNARMSWEKIEAQRNFVNKLWNISRYILENKSPLSRGVDAEGGRGVSGGAGETGAEAWILDRCNNLIGEMKKDIEVFAFSQAGEKLIDFVWNDFADWYLEASKFEESENKKEILPYVLRTILKLAHPFMPFVTEAIWKKFNDSMLMVEKYPVVGTQDFAFLPKSGNFELIKDIVMAIRNARAENKVEPARKIEAVIYAGDKVEIVKQNEILIKSLKTGISDLKILEKGEKISGAIYAAVGEIEIYLLGAVDAEKEKVRLEKEIANLEKFVSALDKKLSNQEFVGKAPEKVVNIEKEKLAKAEAELAKLKEQLAEL